MRLQFSFSALPEHGQTSLRVTYNDKEIESRVLESGMYDITIETPKETGIARAFLVMFNGAQETPLGEAHYWYPDVAGAKQLVEEGHKLDEEKKGRKALAKYREAVRTLEKLAPDSEEMADAYRAVAFAHLFMKCRPAKRAQHNKLAAEWYEKALAVWERNGNTVALAGNLSNIGSLYYRVGDFETALARNLRGLELERARGVENFDEESPHAWTHVVGNYLQLGRLDEADATIEEGLNLFGRETPAASYFYSYRAQVLRARADELDIKASKLAPPDACQIG